MKYPTNIKRYLERRKNKKYKYLTMKFSNLYIDMQKLINPNITIEELKHDIKCYLKKY
jgi:hypothetical protein